MFESAAGQRYSCDHAAATLDGGQIMLAPIVSLSLSLSFSLPANFSGYIIGSASTNWLNVDS